MKKVTFLNLSIHKGEFMFFNTDFLKSEEIYLKLEKVSEGNYVLGEREKCIYRINFK